MSGSRWVDLARLILFYAIFALAGVYLYNNNDIDIH